MKNPDVDLNILLLRNLTESFTIYYEFNIMWPLKL